MVKQEVWNSILPTYEIIYEIIYMENMLFYMTLSYVSSRHAEASESHFVASDSAGR